MIIKFYQLSILLTSALVLRMDVLCCIANEKVQRVDKPDTQNTTRCSWTT